jgi:hypothetical protein
MMVSYPAYTAGIIKLLCRQHGMDPGDAVKWVGDSHFTVRDCYGRNIPEAQVAAELRNIYERRKK